MALVIVIDAVLYLYIPCGINVEDDVSCRAKHSTVLARLDPHRRAETITTEEVCVLC